MRISVIIPTLNEVDALPSVLTAPALDDANCQIIVSDGGSTDGTMCVARRHGATVVLGTPGRGQQLVQGLAAADGEVVLFLHADTHLPPNALAQVRAALTDSKSIGGNFALTFDGNDGFAAWLNGFYAWIRSHGYYYGDSAIFVRREALVALGGVRPISLMEDYDLVRRMERTRRTVCLSAPGAVTSSRRFAGRPPWRIVAQWLYLHALFHLGLSPDWLARLYRSHRHNPAEI